VVDKTAPLTFIGYEYLFNRRCGRRVVQPKIMQLRASHGRLKLGGEKERQESSDVLSTWTRGRKGRILVDRAEGANLEKSQKDRKGIFSNRGEGGGTNT